MLNFEELGQDVWHVSKRGVPTPKTVAGFVPWYCDWQAIALFYYIFLTNAAGAGLALIGFSSLFRLVAGGA